MSNRNRASILRPTVRREPLQDLQMLSAANNSDEDTTSTISLARRRVSFSGRTSVKEYAPCAETIHVKSTPAYEEPFAHISSDSSCLGNNSGPTDENNMSETLVNHESNMNHTRAAANLNNRNMQQQYRNSLPQQQQQQVAAANDAQDDSLNTSDMCMTEPMLYKSFAKDQAAVDVSLAAGSMSHATGNMSLTPVAINRAADTSCSGDMSFTKVLVGGAASQNNSTCMNFTLATNNNNNNGLSQNSSMSFTRAIVANDDKFSTTLSQNNTMSFTKAIVASDETFSAGLSQNKTMSFTKAIVASNETFSAANNTMSFTKAIVANDDTFSAGNNSMSFTKAIVAGDENGLSQNNFKKTTVANDTIMSTGNASMSFTKALKADASMTIDELSMNFKDGADTDEEMRRLMREVELEETLDSEKLKSYRLSDVSFLVRENLVSGKSRADKRGAMRLSLMAAASSNSPIDLSVTSNRFGQQADIEEEEFEDEERTRLEEEEEEGRLGVEEEEEGRLGLEEEEDEGRLGIEEEKEEEVVDRMETDDAEIQADNVINNAENLDMSIVEDNEDVTNGSVKQKDDKSEGKEEEEALDFDLREETFVSKRGVVEEETFCLNLNSVSGEMVEECTMAREDEEGGGEEEERGGGEKGSDEAGVKQQDASANEKEQSTDAASSNQSSPPTVVANPLPAEQLLQACTRSKRKSDSLDMGHTDCDVIESPSKVARLEVEEVMAAAAEEEEEEEEEVGPPTTTATPNQSSSSDSLGVTMSVSEMAESMFEASRFLASLNNSVDLSGAAEIPVRYVKEEVAPLETRYCFYGGAMVVRVERKSGATDQLQAATIYVDQDAKDHCLIFANKTKRVFEEKVVGCQSLAAVQKAIADVNSFAYEHEQQHKDLTRLWTSARLDIIDGRLKYNAVSYDTMTWFSVTMDSDILFEGLSDDAITVKSFIGNVDESYIKHLYRCCVCSPDRLKDFTDSVEKYVTSPKT